MSNLMQLKAIRDAALDRLSNNPDFKTVNALEDLIQDLETVSSMETQLAASLQASMDSEEDETDTTSELEDAITQSESSLNGSGYNGSTNYQ